MSEYLPERKLILGNYEIEICHNTPHFTHVMVSARRDGKLIHFETVDRYKWMGHCNGQLWIPEFIKRVKQVEASVEPQEPKAPEWVTPEEIRHYLRRHDCPDDIADRLSERYASNLQAMFNKGFSLGWKRGIEKPNTLASSTGNPGMSVQHQTCPIPKENMSEDKYPPTANQEVKPATPIPPPEVPPTVAQTKSWRAGLDVILQMMKTANDDGPFEAVPGQELPIRRKSRERSLAITKVQEAIMWLGMDLKDQGTPNPYPHSYDPTSAIIDKTADGLKL